MGSIPACIGVKGQAAFAFRHSRPNLESPKDPQSPSEVSEQQGLVLKPDGLDGYADGLEISPSTWRPGAQSVWKPPSRNCPPDRAPVMKMRSRSCSNEPDPTSAP